MDEFYGDMFEDDPIEWTESTQTPTSTMVFEADTTQAIEAIEELKHALDTVPYWRIGLKIGLWPWFLGAITGASVAVAIMMGVQ